MKKKLIMCVLVLLLALLVTVSAGAQLRLEANLTYPVFGGIGLGSSFNSSVDFSQYHFLVPDFRIYYQFGDGLLTGGVGARVYTVILLSLIYPEAYVELHLDPIVLEASLGGYVFGVFGLYSNLSTADLLLPDLNVGWQLAPWFRLNAGVLFFAPVSSSWSVNNAYMGYISARFIFLLK
jgi:hypothetical protein